MQNINLVETAFTVMKFFVPFLFALCFHEFAHGWVARLRGDRTAEIMGRLTLNPMAHADPIGTVLFPIVGMLSNFPLFGWAKPVPVDERNLKNPRVDMFWIAAAGPLSNLLLAFVSAIVMGVYVGLNEVALAERQQGAMVVLEVMKTFVLMNVFLAVFNMIPLHPLDGGKVLARFLPENLNRKLEDMQSVSGMILIVLALTGGIHLIAYPAFWIAGQFSIVAGAIAGLV